MCHRVLVLTALTWLGHISVHHSQYLNENMMTVVGLFAHVVVNQI